MSGICGFVAGKNFFAGASKARDELERMNVSLAHRGRDGAGAWIDIEGRVAMGHRRLRLTDPTDAGKQPMTSDSERYILALDGAITNYLELRETLLEQGVQFRSDSQAEVLLALIERHGVKAALQDAIGQLGLVLYDRKEKRLYLARDRFGLKTVYYGWHKGVFVFASELKAIKALSFFEPEIDTDSVYLFLKYQYVKSPWSIYRGINKLLPAEILSLDLETGETHSEKYYSLEDVAVAAEHDRFSGSLDECVDEMERVLTEAVTRAVQACVPAGAFLSSGLDSSVVSAIAQKALNGKLKTYSVGCYSEKLNDAEMAKEYARVLGTDHHELYLDEKEFFDLMPRLAGIYDEPFAQPSAIPYFYISKEAKKDVGIVLGGDGGDELFGFIPLIQQVFSYQNGFPYDGRDYTIFSDLYDYLQYILFKTTGFRDEMFAFPVPTQRHYGQFAPNRIKDDYLRAMCFDLRIFNESETMTKVDRASMANGLQVREPILDPSVVALGFRLPDHFRYDRGVFRVAQRKLLARYIPERMIEKQKRAFHIPINRFILSDSFRDVREWAFSEETLEQSGFFRVPETKAMLQEQLTQYGKLPVQSFTNNVLVLQLWLKENGFIK